MVDEVSLNEDAENGEYIVLPSLTDYNTYKIKGLPIGAIANPGIDSIKAVLNPVKTDYFYFVADKNGKTYFNETDSGHQKTCNKLKSDGLWIEYEN